jgi:DeoR/GlpR family transcriptional regulator of sugar metabolism
VDSSKFDKVAFSKVCDVKDIDIIVTDEKPTATWLELFEHYGIKCLYPGMEAEKE